MSPLILMSNYRALALVRLLSIVLIPFILLLHEIMEILVDRIKIIGGRIQIVEDPNKLGYQSSFPKISSNFDRIAPKTSN